MRTSLIILILSAFSILTFAQEKKLPYDTTANVRDDIKMAVEKAKKENKHVMIQFGGNWCPWCIRFHAMVQNDHLLDSLMKADYIYVLADVPRKKDQRDYELFRQYNYPNRFGYPVFVILDGNGKEIHIQDSGILEHCTEKGYDTTKVVTFLRQWNVKALDPASYKTK